MVHWTSIALLVTTLGAVLPAPGMAASAACGDALTASVTLDADLACGAGGLTVAVDGIVIDLAGHTISGTSGNGIDNALGFDRVTVKNGTIDGFENGIVHGGGEKHVIRAMRVRNGVSSILLAAGVRFSKIEKSFVGSNTGRMIEVFGDDNVVTRVVATNSSGLGITIYGNRNVVTKNTVANALDGIALSGAASGTIVSGNAVANGRGSGIILALFGGTGGNVVTKNRSDGNGDEGIIVTGTDDTVVSGNTVIGNAIGIRIGTAARTVVAKNVAVANDDDGIVIAAAAVGTVVTANKAERNADAGVSTISPSSIFTKNFAFANGTNGIEAADGAIDGGGNKGRNNALADCSPVFACK